MRIDNHHHHKKAGENLAFVFCLNLTFNIIVIIGAISTNSMAILADFLHDASDTVSIGIAWILEKVSQKDSSDNYSYGYQRFSVLGSVIISLFVISMACVILIEAVPRLFSPEAVDPRGMLAVAVLGIVFKFLSSYRLHNGETFNEKAIFFHQLGDFFEWILILVLSIILMFRGDISYLDPFISILIALWLFYNLGRTLYKSLEVLLQKTPDNFDVSQFKDNILAVEGVKSLEDFHIWSLDGIDSVMTLKVNVDFSHDVETIRNEIYEISNRYHVVDITIEFF